MGWFSHWSEQKQPNVPAIPEAAGLGPYFLGQRHLANSIPTEETWFKQVLIITLICTTIVLPFTEL